MALDTNFKIVLYKDRNYAIFHMKMASFRLWAYNPRTGLPVFLWRTMSFHQYWQSQTTNQSSLKLTKYQIINQQHSYMKINAYYEK